MLVLLCQMHGLTETYLLNFLVSFTTGQCLSSSLMVLNL